MTPENIFYRIQNSLSAVKLFSLSAGLLLLCFTGCKKESQGDPANPKGEYYLKFKANGTQKLIDYAVIQGQDIESQTTDAYGGKVFLYSIGAAKISGEMVGLGFVSQTRLTAPATFRESAGISGTDKTATLMYNKSLADIDPLMSIGVLDPLNNYASVVRDVIIDITEYNTTYIKGTFSGTVYPADDDMGPVLSGKIAITEGEFKLKLP
ncbi:MAG: hypothetical protein QM594_13740 [Niabella sp.]